MGVIMKFTIRLILHSNFLFLVLASLVIYSPVQTGISRKVEMTAGNQSASPFDLGWADGYSINGAGPVVRAVAVDGKNIYIGGDFSVAGNILANKVAMWDGTGWQPLGEGLNGSVLALAIDGRGHLFAGGQFTQASGKPVNHIARWDGKEWQPLGAGSDGDVSTLAIDPCGNLYAGG